MRSSVIVEWRDSVSIGGWQLIDEMDGWAGETISTLGFVMSETEQDLVLAMSVGTPGSGRESACNWISIPKVCILSRKDLDAT